MRPKGLPLATPARGGQVLLAEGFTGGSDGVQGVALGAGATGWPLGSADLEDVFPTLQEHRQTGIDAIRIARDAGWL